MDDALVLIFHRPNLLPSLRVLILVLMDDALVQLLSGRICYIAPES